MLNRSALILRSKQPLVDWLNAADPRGAKTTLEEANQDNTVYLIEVEDEEELEIWLKENAERLFADELSGWLTDENLWPKKLNLETLKKWFDIQWHSLVLDTGLTRLEDDEAMDEDDFEIDDENEDNVEDDPADPGAGRR